jgi:PucR family transcriptional regulator, purine catabolism regulatory protein
MAERWVPSSGGMPTLADVLSLPEMQRGHPSVEAGRRAMDRPVRWVHVSEVADIAHLLMGGELILSTGVAFPAEADALARYVSDLAAAQVAGVVIELGRRYAELPSALVESAEAHGLPLIALHTEVPFVAITEAIHSIIVNIQVKQLQRHDTIHRAFRSLAAEAATAQDIIDRMAELAGSPVVFESTARHVLSFARMGIRSTDLLKDWDARSREAGWASHTTVAGAERWLTSPVSAKGQIWGRLVVLRHRPSAADHAIIIEQGATTLALHLLIERDEHSLEQQTHGALIADIINHRYTVPEDIHTQAEALGLPVRHRVLVPMIVVSELDPTLPDIERHRRAREEVTAISGAVTDSATPGLVGLMEPHRIGVVLSATTHDAASLLIEATTAAVHDRTKRLVPTRPVVIGVGSPVTDVTSLRRSFAEAGEAAEVAWGLPPDRSYATVADIHLKGLMHLLREDPRLRSYAERELGPLVEYDHRRRTDLSKTLAAFLEVGGNKSAAATRAHVTRATLYHHLARIEEILGCNVDDPEVRYSLYVALLTQQALRS